MKVSAFAGLAAALLVASLYVLAHASSRSEEPDGLRLSAAYPEVAVGDRLFFESRFAQYFFAHNNGDLNAPLEKGDSLVEEVAAVDRPALSGPFRGQSISCRHCHLGDDFVEAKPLAGRTYVDFSRRSLIPRRGDGLVTTPRNSPTMVGFGLPREVPVLLHFDGEFASPEDLTTATLTGRNFGWLPHEAKEAVAHIARVIREDNGTNPRYVLDQSRKGIPYRVVMLGTAPDLRPEFRVPEQYRIDVMKASDEQVLEAIAKFVHAYVDSLRFGTHNTFRSTASPYDLFLRKNQLPEGPQRGETNLQYGANLLGLLERQDSFEWVSPGQDGMFELHDQPYRFGATELKGLKIFLSRNENRQGNSVGNCVMCHTPPQFTDHRLHNTGVSQNEYDQIFGSGAFWNLQIPGLAERNAKFDEYLPPSPNHPGAQGRFRMPPVANQPAFADLGAWNVFANPDLPKPQQALREILCGQKTCDPQLILPTTIALFKTPSIRDLGQSNPFFHSGGFDTLEDVVQFYIRTSELARNGKLRNSSLEIEGMNLSLADVEPLVTFLKSLNEDYR